MKVNENLTNEQALEMLEGMDPDLLHEIMNSDKPDDIKFQRWVFHTVLPSISKLGMFTANSDLGDKIDEVYDMADTINDKVDRIAAMLEGMTAKAEDDGE